MSTRSHRAALAGTTAAILTATALAILLASDAQVVSDEQFLESRHAQALNIIEAADLVVADVEVRATQNIEGTTIVDLAFREILAVGVVPSSLSREAPIVPPVAHVEFALAAEHDELISMMTADGAIIALAQVLDATGDLSAPEWSLVAVLSVDGGQLKVVNDRGVDLSAEFADLSVQKLIDGPAALRDELIAWIQDVHEARAAGSDVASVGRTMAFAELFAVAADDAWENRPVWQRPIDPELAPPQISEQIQMIAVVIEGAPPSGYLRATTVDGVALIVDLAAMDGSFVDLIAIVGDRATVTFEILDSPNASAGEQVIVADVSIGAPRLIDLYTKTMTELTSDQFDARLAEIRRDSERIP